MPGVKFAEGVRANDEYKCVGGMLGAQFADGVERVGGAGAVQLDGEGGKPGLIRDGEAQHGEAVFVGGQVVRGLMRRHRAGNKPNGVQRKEAKGFPRDGEMPLVDGVKGAAKQSDGARH